MRHTRQATICSFVRLRRASTSFSRRSKSYWRFQMAWDGRSNHLRHVAFAGPAPRRAARRRTRGARPRTSQCLSASSAWVRSFCSLIAMIAARCFSNSASESPDTVFGGRG